MTLGHFFFESGEFDLDDGAASPPCHIMNRYLVLSPPVLLSVSLPPFAWFSVKAVPLVEVAISLSDVLF
jgi:hypothetical protein